ncbi:MAG TPA: cobalt ECF transporter T component CbiQ [Archaeoglobaceae archaeon]|nr:cobalt ECF transporter T component CbiQ [Archaeoglobaceae archaeon]
MEIIERTAKEASSFFKNFFSYDVVDGRFLRNVDSRIKIPGLLAFVIASVSTFHPYKLILLFLILSVLISVSRIPVKVYTERIWMIPAFSVVVLTPYVFLGNIDYVLLFSFRVFLAVSFLTLFMISTSFSEMITAMRFYRIPDILVTVIVLTYQYIHLMFSELYRIFIARESRKIKNESFSEIWRNGGKSVGHFFIRAYERAERVHLASVARGFNDRTKVYGKDLKLKTSEISFILITGFGIAAYLYI